MKKKILYAFAIWCGLLVLGALTVGGGIWKLRSAVNTVRSDNLTEVDAKDFARDIAWSNALLKIANLNPGVQLLRVVPGVTWAPKTLSVGANIVSEVHSLLKNGGTEMLATALSGELTPKPGTIDVHAAAGVAENAQGISESMVRLRSAISDLGELHVPWVGGKRMRDSVAKATDYLDVAESALAALQQLPELIGSEAPMRYFVGITNEAELRGVQGIIGEYAIIEIDHGKIVVARSGSNTELKNPKELPTELIGEYSDIYGKNNTEWQNVNLSPFFEPAALQITNAWKQQSGESLDGVILLDTVALARWAIPKVGSVQTAQGRKLETWEALADYLSNGVYFEFPSDQQARKSFQSELATRLLTAITDSPIELEQLLRSLTDPILEGRVVMWLNGAVGRNFNATYMAKSSESFQSDVVVGLNNWTGNKMDFYLRGEIEQYLTCDGDGEVHTANIALINTASADENYPDYLSRRLDLKPTDSKVVGSYLDVSVVTRGGVEFKGFQQDGIDTGYEIHRKGELRTTIRFQVEVSAGAKTSIQLQFIAKNGCSPLEIDLSPLRFGWQTP